MAILRKRALILREACVLGSAFRRFLRRFNPKEHGLTSEKIWVAAFGKHPGWDDHIDDIGIETDVLVTVKRMLYVQGIGGNVGAGSWEKLTNDQLIGEFKHVLFWYVDGQLIVGRMWSSRDGKGRKSYPFVVCVQCRKLPMQWVFDNVVPRLERIERTCTSTTSASDVRMAVQSANRELRQLAGQYEASLYSIVAYPDALARLAQHPEMGPNREGLFRILYHIDREFGPSYPDAVNGKTARSTLVRLPTSPNTTQENVLLWSSFLLARFGKTTSVLILVPPTGDWMDIIIGEATESQLYCLRASLKVIPLTSSIPYNIGLEFIDEVDHFMQGSRS